MASTDLGDGVARQGYKDSLCNLVG
jgi:hypothetical protein